mmetsp:Transcript_24094/g.33876  ORF Transcript_24094/g.33876 Transcript_24094/m.33876 type:complete len:125 (+) Transcript_24094:186-560(+)
MTKYDTLVSGTDVETAESTNLINAKEDGEDISVTCRFKKVTATALTLVAVLAVLALAASRFSTGTVTRPSSVLDPEQLGLPYLSSCDGDNQCDAGLKCCHRATSRGMACHDANTAYSYCPWGNP